MLGASALAPRTLFAQAKAPPALVGWLSLRSRASGARTLAVLKALGLTMPPEIMVRADRLIE